MTKQQQDARDDRLMQEGRHSELLAAYYPVIVARLRMRVPDGVAYDVAHDAMVRLLDELRRGKVYACPFRVVAHQVAIYCLGDHRVAERDRPDTPLPPDALVWETEAADDGAVDAVVEDDWLAYQLRSLTPHDRRIAAMYFGMEMPIAEIADAVGVSRNAVDQALFRAKRHLKARWGDD